MDRYRLVEDCTRSIKEKTGMLFTSYVYWKYGNSGSDKLSSSLNGGDRKLLNNYIQEFLYGDKECLQSLMNIILNEYYGGREEVLVLRLAEFCYHSLIELDEKTVYLYV